MVQNPNSQTAPAPSRRKRAGRIIKRTLRYVALALVALLFVGTFWFLWQKSQPVPETYELLDAARRDLSRTTVVTGTVEPRDEVLIKPQISGIIAELYKEAGELVKKGEVIAKVKVIPEMSSLSSAENRVRLAEINLAQAETDYSRTKQLFDEQLVSAEEHEKALLALRQAREEKSAATDALQIVREGVSASNASYSTTLIRSTIDGLILDVPVKVGNSVIMSNTFNDGTTIATVANMSDLIFKGTIDETEVDRLVEGMPMKISVGALPDREFSARLEYVAPKVASSDGSANQFEIKAALTVPADVKIRAGYSANAEIILEERRGVTSVPEAAVEFDGDKAFVYVLQSAQPQSFKRREVKTGLSDGLHIEIASGLKPGEKVRGNQIQNPGAE